jgi:hypothetical protein
VCVAVHHHIIASPHYFCCCDHHDKKTKICASLPHYALVAALAQMMHFRNRNQNRFTHSASAQYTKYDNGVAACEHTDNANDKQAMEEKCSIDVHIYKFVTVQKAAVHFGESLSSALPHRSHLLSRPFLALRVTTAPIMALR